MIDVQPLGYDVPPAALRSSIHETERTKLRNLAEAGRHFEGRGLYLEVTAAGGRYWRMKYRHAGKEKRLS